MSLNLMILLLAVVASTVIVVAPPPPPLPQRCIATPRRWAGDMMEIDYDTGFFRMAEIVYNEEEETVYIREFEDDGTGQRPTHKQEWFDFKEKKKYNQTFGGRCMEYIMTSSFRPFGLPPSSVYRGREYLGANVPGLGVEVDRFHDDINGGYYRGLWAPSPMTNAPDVLCVPILESYRRSAARFSDSRNIHTEFLNITVTFPAPPEHCEPTNVVVNRL